jgi:hypothetical protein
MFATPIAYLLDEKGIIAADVAAGIEPIRALLSRLAASSGKAPERRCACGRPLGACGCGRHVGARRG